MYVDALFMFFYLFVFFSSHNLNQRWISSTKYKNNILRKKKQFKTNENRYAQQQLIP